MEREILSKYKKQEEKLILSKVIDKIDFCNTRNQIQYTDFLDLSQKQLIDKFLKSQKISNYIFYGGIEDAERTILLIYPNKIRELIDKVDFNKYITVIKIDLPNENRGKYSHRNYLGAIMKLGVKREKIGDIIVNDIGADILVHPEIEKFLLIHLPELTRFSKAKIEKVLLEKIRELKIKKEEIDINIPSMRLDNIVSELVKSSRSKANEIILSERVLVNFEVITKITKEIKEKDIITIRGKGRFQVKEIIGNTRKGRIIIRVEISC